MEYEKNGVMYQRDVDHCELNPYVKMVTIKEIKPAINSDNLDAIIFEEIGWCAVSQKGLHKAGKKVMFIPAESVLPFELGEQLEVTKYLSSGRLRAIKLRGNRSEGLIVDVEKVEPWLDSIMKWEDKPTIGMSGMSTGGHPHFHKFYKMPNILNEPHTFKIGEKIYYSEKMHGTNFRFGRLRDIDTDDYKSFVGSHNICLKESDTNIYWKVFKEIYEDKVPRDIVFYAEIFGLGIQDLHYNAKTPESIIFAVSFKGYYLTIPALKIVCQDNDLKHIDFHFDKFKSIDQLRELADEPSECAENHMREGIVVVSAEYPDRMAKCLGDTYMDRKNKLERH